MQQICRSGGFEGECLKSLRFMSHSSLATGCCAVAVVLTMEVWAIP